MHTIACGVHQHGGRAVHNIAGRELPVSRLQHIDQRVAQIGGVRLTAEDGEDGPDAHVDINITGAIQRVKDNNMLAVPINGARLQWVLRLPWKP